jgi:hypothetical protein
MKRLCCAVALLASAVSGCVTYDRGHYAALSTTLPPVATTVVAEAVEGRACGSLFDAPLRRAIADALARTPEANALTEVSYAVEELCMVVRGRAVHVP